MAIQTSILGLALLVGVIHQQEPAEATLKLPEGSPTRQRKHRAAVEKQLAKLDRLQNDGMRQLMEPMLESLQPELAVQQPNLQKTFQAMGALLPVQGMFSNSMTSLADGWNDDALPPPAAIDFLGETLRAQRIVLLIDVSGSVKSKMERAGVSMETLQQEMTKFVDQLGPNHLFGIIQFTRNWQAFRDELLPATEVVQQEAHQWIGSSFRTTGTSGRDWTRGNPNGIEGVLAAAFAMDPQLDEIFLISDADFQRTPPGGGGQDVPWSQLRTLTKALQQESIGTTRLRALCFYPPEGALPDLGAWTRENGPGTVRIIDQ